jgi:hypothetical protein
MVGTVPSKYPCRAARRVFVELLSCHAGALCVECKQSLCVSLSYHFNSHSIASAGYSTIFDKANHRHNGVSYPVSKNATSAWGMNKIICLNGESFIRRFPKLASIIKC